MKTSKTGASRASARKQLDTPVDFSKLTGAEKRVWVAKDILAAIALDKFLPRHSHGALELTKTPVCGPLREQMTNLKSCAGCAITSAFFGLVARDNRFDLFDVDISYNGRVNVHNERQRKRLRKIFSRQQLAMLEVAFEGHPAFAQYEWVYDQDECIKRSIVFGNRFFMAKERLIAIWQNVIDNNGEFKP